jgi:XTP/dITP diphosphohydrolase
MRTIILATTNQGKIAEIRELLDGIAEIVLPDNLPNVVEDGSSLAENAYKKAKSAADFLNLEAVADDSGLFVEGINGMPGVHSARYAGNDADDYSNRQKLLAELAEVENRKAYFSTVICLCSPHQAFQEANFFEGRCQGTISWEEIGTNGFGYDSIFVPDDGDGRTFAQMNSAEKAKYSHRARAIEQFKNALRSGL